MNTPSLADSAVAALAAVAQMDATITNDDPERHQVRALKRAAEQILADAIRQAHSLAWLAEELSRTMKKKQG